MEQINVIIRDGKARVETRGFSGAACLNATKDLERVMGKTVSDSKTPEYDLKHAQVAGR